MNNLHHNNNRRYDGPSAVDLLSIFMCMPVYNSFSYCPWKLYTLFDKYLHLSSTQQQHQDTTLLADRTLLITLFQEIIQQHNIDKDYLTNYFSRLYIKKKATSYFSPTINILKQNVRDSLQLIEYCTLRSVIDVLKRNETVLIFEYLRCCSRYYSMKPYGFLLKQQYLMHAEKYSVSRKLLLIWAVECIGITSEQACKFSTAVSFISGTEQFSYSMFLVFALQCSFTAYDQQKVNIASITLNNNINNSYIDSSSHDEDTLPIITSSHVGACKWMIELFTEKLNTLNCLFRVNLLNVLGISSLLSSPEINNTINLSSASILAIYSCAHDTFNKTLTNLLYSNSNLPPRPIVPLWDAPRFIEFCKFIGILPLIKSISELWTTFGYFLLDAEYISRINQWGEGVVSPMCFSVTTDHILQVLTCILLSFLPNYTLNTMTLQYTLPAIVITTDICIDTTTTVLSSDKSILSPILSDLLRFGGDNVVYFLHQESKFLYELYNVIFMNKHESKSNIEVLVKYLTFDEQLPSDLLYECLNKSFGFINFAITDITSETDTTILCYVEFEEICLHYAYELWCLYRKDVLVQPTATTATTQNDVAGDDEKFTSPLVRQYVQQCLMVALDPAYRRFNSWGINFISPLLNLLKSEYQDDLLISQFDSSGTMHEGETDSPVDLSAADTSFQEEEDEAECGEGCYDHENTVSSRVVPSPSTIPARNSYEVVKLDVVPKEDDSSNRASHCELSGIAQIEACEDSGDRDER